jgi:hypothetical protein
LFVTKVSPPRLRCGTRADVNAPDTRCAEAAVVGLMVAVVVGVVVAPHANGE